MKVVSKELREFEKWKIPSLEAPHPSLLPHGEGMHCLVLLTG